MKDSGIVAGLTDIEPLVRMTDLAEYRAGLARHLSGEWDAERWTAYRVRFGVYGQRQPGVQMIRVKVPGGIVAVPWLRTLARLNRDFAQGDVHVTTRQDFQLYSVPLERTADFLESLYSAGLTTREACGNTLRNMTACALAGVCPRELVDAGQVADRLARSWLRQPLVQHMPRKVKISVSGCGTDCGGASIHDLAFVATEKDGAKGFRVHAGGGLGGSPRSAVVVLDFATEEQLPVAVEALARLHQRYSDRANRNASRIKFVAKRFGEAKFRALFQEEFARLLALPQRPWQPLAWRDGEEAAVARTPMGLVSQHDGRLAVVAAPPLGLLSSDQLEAVADIAEAAGVTQLRTTRDQNLVLVGVAAEEVAEVVAKLRAAGVPVPERADAVPDVISCPGTTTCRIGITNSQNFGLEVLRQAEGDPNANGVSVRVSGCQNSCGLHHVGDFGFHGMAKKILGRPAPHYQVHFGGDQRNGGAIALAGPIVPAKLAPKALKLLRDAYAAGRDEGEPVRAWAERLGKAGLAQILRPLDDEATDEGLFVDWGDAEGFNPPPQGGGDCAAPFATNDLLIDLSDDALILADRSLAAQRWDEALRALDSATVYATRRVLFANGADVDEDEPAAAVQELARTALHHRPDLLRVLDAVEAHRMGALGTGRAEDYREAVALWLDTVRQQLDGAVLGLAAE